MEFKIAEEIKSDEMIIDLYFERSESAIVATREKYGSYCFSLAYRILSSREDSEEAISDLWLSLWNSIPPQRPQSLKAYISSILRNISLNFIEKRNASKRKGVITGIVDEFEELLPSPEQSPDDAVIMKETLNSFLRTLNSEERMIFMRRYFFTMSVKEIASSMKLGESKVKVSLFKTRNKLKDYLKKEGYTYNE